MRLLLAFGAEVDLQNPQPNPAAHVSVNVVYVAALHCDAALFQEVISKGADPSFSIANTSNQGGKLDGRTALFPADYNYRQKGMANCKAIVEELEKRGIRKNVKDNS